MGGGCLKLIKSKQTMLERSNVKIKNQNRSTESKTMATADLLRT